MHPATCFFFPLYSSSSKHRYTTLAPDPIMEYPPACSLLESGSVALLGRPLSDGPTRLPLAKVSYVPT